MDADRLLAPALPILYEEVTPKQINPPEPRRIPGDFHVRPTGFEPATFRVGVVQKARKITISAL